MSNRFSIRSSKLSLPSLLTIFVVIVGFLPGCGESEADRLARQQRELEARQREAIRRVMQVDKTFAQVRDQNGGKTDFDKVAAAAQQYVQSLMATDMSELPADVREAYEKHARTWQDMVIFLNEYTGVTGAFRRGWDSEGTKFRFMTLSKAIEESWNDVKAKAAAHGVDMSAQR